MFSLVSVCSQEKGPNVTITQDALNLTAQAPLLVTSGGNHSRHVQTCSFEDPLPTISTDICWPKHVRLASGRYTSYWNAFLYQQIFLPAVPVDIATMVKEKFTTVKPVNAENVYK